MKGDSFRSAKVPHNATTENFSSAHCLWPHKSYDRSMYLRMHATRYVQYGDSRAATSKPRRLSTVRRHPMSHNYIMRFAYVANSSPVLFLLREPDR